MQMALRPHLAAIARRSRAAAALAEELLAWDARMTPSSGSGLRFVMLKEIMFEELFGDELGADLEALKAIAKLSYNPLQEAWHSGRSSFWDDVTTPAEETAADIWARVLDRTARRAAAAGAASLGEWRGLVFPHAFHQVPVLGRLFDVGPLPTGGDDHTVNVAKATFANTRQPQFIPSYRVIYTPAQWRQTRGTQPLGQSGHLLSPYRADQLADWQAGGLHRWPWHGWPAGTGMVGTLVLQPAD